MDEYTFENWYIRVMQEVPMTIRKRSPRFPSHSLKEALVYAEKLYEGVHRSSVDSDTAVRVMGFSGKSGASASALGSVRQYGLIEGFSDSTRISDLALVLFEPSSGDEYGRALRQAAFEPKAFSEISERFSGKIPSVDEPIRAYLVRDLGFSSKGAKNCIESLRLTLSFLEEFDSDSHVDSGSGDGSLISAISADTHLSSTTMAVESHSSRPLAISEHVTQARFPLAKECYAELTIFGDASSKAFENLKLQVDLLISALKDD